MGNITLQEFIDKKSVYELQLLEYIKGLYREFEKETGMKVSDFVVFKNQDGSLGDLKFYLDF